MTGRFWSIFFIAAAIPVLGAGLALGQPAPQPPPEEDEGELDQATFTRLGRYCVTYSGIRCQLRAPARVGSSCACNVDGQSEEGSVQQ